MPLPLFTLGALTRIPTIIGAGAAAFETAQKLASLSEESSRTLQEYPVAGLQGGGWNDGTDAFRHAYAAARITQELRDSFAEYVSPETASNVAAQVAVGLGAAYEAKSRVGEFFRNEKTDPADVGMDYWNNRVGAEIGRNLPVNATPEQIRDALVQAFERNELVTSIEDPRAMAAYETGPSLAGKGFDTERATMVAAWAQHNEQAGRGLEERSSFAAFALNEMAREHPQMCERGPEGALTANVQSLREGLAQELRAQAAPGFSLLAQPVAAHEDSIERQALSATLAALQERGLVSEPLVSNLMVRVLDGTPATWEAAAAGEMLTLAENLQGTPSDASAERVAEPLAVRGQLGEDGPVLLSLDARAARELAQQSGQWDAQNLLQYAFLHEVGHLREENQLASELVAAASGSSAGATLGREMNADLFAIAATQATQGREAALELAANVIELREAQARGELAEPAEGHHTTPAVMVAAQDLERGELDTVRALEEGVGSVLVAQIEPTREATNERTSSQETEADFEMA